MRFTTRTEYGLVCLVYMARRDAGEMIRIKDIIKAERFSMPYVEKILQKLRAAEIVTSHQGKGGGYSLARHPSQITLKEIINALEGGTFEIFCEPEVRAHIVCTHLCLCGIAPVWAKTKKILDEYYSSVTLESLAKGAGEKQIEQVTAGKE